MTKLMQSICTCAYKSHITIIICTNEFEEYMIYRCISTYINACQEFMTVTAGYWSRPSSRHLPRIVCYMWNAGVCWLLACLSCSCMQNICHALMAYTFHGLRQDHDQFTLNWMKFKIEQSLKGTGNAIQISCTMLFQEMYLKFVHFLVAEMYMKCNS